MLEALRPKGHQDQVSALRQEIQQLQGTVLASLHSLPSMVATAVQSANLNGVQLDAKQLQLAALSPDLGLSCVGAISLESQQCKIAEELARLAATLPEEPSPADDAAIAAILGPPSSRQERALEGVISPSKVYLHSTHQPPALTASRKDLLSTFTTQIEEASFSARAVPTATAAETNVDSVPVSSHSTLPTAGVNIGTVTGDATPPSERISLSAGELQQLLQNAAQSGRALPVAPFMPSPMQSTPGNLLFNPSLVHPAAANPPQPPVLPQAYGVVAPSQLSLLPLQTLGYASHPQQVLLQGQSAHPQLMNAALPFGQFGSMMPNPFLQQQQQQQLQQLQLQQQAAMPPPMPRFIAPAAPPSAFVPSNPVLSTEQIAKMVEDKLEEQKQQTAKLSGISTGIRKLPPFGTLGSIAKVRAII